MRTLLKAMIPYKVIYKTSFTTINRSEKLSSNSGERK
jgi:hypothetical protein